MLHWVVEARWADMTDFAIGARSTRSVRIRGSAAVCALPIALCLCDSALAQARSPRFELTPHTGYRLGGDFDQNDGAQVDLGESDAKGILFNVRASANTQWEVLYARQDTKLEPVNGVAGGASLDLDIEHLHFGGTYLFDGRLARPFLALTVGVARFDPSLDAGGGETYFSGSLGGGVHLRADKRIGVRLEGRLFANLVDNDGDLFCSTGPEENVCALAGDGSILYQWEARAGIVFRF